VFDHIVAFSLRNRAAVVFFTLVVVAWGYFSFRSLPIEAFPDPTDTQVQVITLYPGSPPRRSSASSVCRSSAH
jgi:cobalt-zinc-cadmium resistance protein CzcA